METTSNQFAALEIFIKCFFGRRTPLPAKEAKEILLISNRFWIWQDPKQKVFKKGLVGKIRETRTIFHSVREFGNIEQSTLWLDREKPSTDYNLPSQLIRSPLKKKLHFVRLNGFSPAVDSTRVISLAFTNLGKDNGGLPGVTRGYHTLSHHGQVKDAIDEWQLRSFHVEQFSLLDKLKEIKETNGKSLLDNTMTLLGSGMTTLIPTTEIYPFCWRVVVKHGQHLHFARNGRQSTLCNLYLSMHKFRSGSGSIQYFIGTLTGFQKLLNLRMGNLFNSSVGACFYFFSP